MLSCEICLLQVLLKNGMISNGCVLGRQTYLGVGAHVYLDPAPGVDCAVLWEMKIFLQVSELGCVVSKDAMGSAFDRNLTL